MRNAVESIDLYTWKDKYITGSNNRYDWRTISKGSSIRAMQKNAMKAESELVGRSVQSSLAVNESGSGITVVPNQLLLQLPSCRRQIKR